VWTKAQGKRADFVLDRPLFWHCMTFMLGLALSNLWQIPVFTSIFMIVAAAVVSVFALRQKQIWGLLLFSFFVGVFWMSVAFATQEVFPYQAKESVQMKGYATDNALADSDGNYMLRLHTKQIDGEPYDCIVQVYAKGDPGDYILYGQNFQITGTIAEDSFYLNPGAFNYREYLKKQGVAACVLAYGDNAVGKLDGERTGNALMWAVSCVKQNFDSALGQLPARQAAFIAGVFLGDKTEIDREAKDVLVATGIQHAFSVSGLHVAYVILLGAALVKLRRRWRWSGFAIACFLLLFYLLMTGIAPPVVRSCVMGFLLLLALVLDEKTDLYTSVGIAALLCLLARPLWITDAGFLLSFTSVLGIAYLMPLWQKILPGTSSFGEMLKDAFSISLAASLCIMPLIAYYFSIASLIGFVISPVLLPLIGFVVILSVCAAFGAVLGAAIAVLPLYAAGLLMDFIFACAQLAEKVPFASMYLAKPGWALILVYLSILIVAVPLYRKYGKKVAVAVLAAAMIVFIVPLATAPVTSPVHADLQGAVLEVDFLDVGQGDAVFILTPQGNTILLDGGGKMGDTSIADQVLIPYLRYRNVSDIDLMIASHPHADHTGSFLALFGDLEVDRLLVADAYPECELYDQLIDTAKDHGTQIDIACRGDVYRLEDGLYLTVYAPDAGETFAEGEENGGSLICKLSYEDIDFLFTGDADYTELASIIADPIDSEVLKVPHHGSKTSFADAFYEQVAPDYCVISVGENNLYGHPAAVVLDYLQQTQITYFRTDQDGAIIMFTDGSRIQVTTQQ